MPKILYIFPLLWNVF